MPKVIDKSQADIDAAIAAINSCDLSSNTNDLAISCIRLAVWLPRALLEHKIKLSNLRKLIFGFGGKNKKKSKQNAEKPTAKVTKDHNDNATSEETAELSTSTSVTNQARRPGHGRLTLCLYQRNRTSLIHSGSEDR